MVAGVTFISDAYPNVKYKIKYLVEKEKYLCNIYNIIGDNKVNTFYNTNKYVFIVKYIVFSIVCFFKAIKEQPRLIYLPYPGILITLLFSLVPTQKRPQLYLDSFISLYDTIVVDRRIFNVSNILCKAIYIMEKIAFSISDIIITDTEESSIYLSKLFGIPLNKFINCTLAQIPLKPKSRTKIETPVLNCLFVGTFIPLQGVEYIAKAICMLKSEDNVHIKLIGNGQTAPAVERVLKTANKNIFTWEKKWQSIDQISFEVQKSDVCLGIFGSTSKAKRVWPYKNYLYLSGGCPVITSRTPCAESITQLDADSPIFFPKKNTPESLVELLKELSVCKKYLLTEREKSRKFYDKYFSNKIVFKNLKKILMENQIQNTKNG